MRKGKNCLFYSMVHFAEYNPKGGDTFGDPSVMLIHIPESERQRQDNREFAEYAKKDIHESSVFAGSGSD